MSEPQTKPMPKRVNTSKNNKGMFESWEFPDYKYEEYPKWIGEGATRKLVNSKREEIMARGENPDDFAEPENPVVKENLDLKRQLDDMQKQIDLLLKAQQTKPAKVEVKGTAPSETDYAPPAQAKKV